MTGRGVADADGPGSPDLCGLDVERCITCGDVALPLTVLAVDADAGDVRCVDEEGREELVAVDLVGPVSPGDRLLVHAGVAIDRIGSGPRAAAGRNGTDETGEGG